LFSFFRAENQALVAGAGVGGVFGAGGGHRGGAQGGFEPSVAMPGLAGFAFAGGFVVPGADPGPEVCPKVMNQSGGEIPSQGWVVIIGVPWLWFDGS
jgi:hypothetical protein